MICPKQNDSFEWFKSELWQTGFVLVAVFSVISTVLSLRLIDSHFRNYSSPAMQRPITRVASLLIQILFIVPIYSACSFLTYLVSNSIYISIIRDAYEGFVMYNFLKLFLEYLGPDENTRNDILSQKSKSIYAPPLCCCTFSPSSPYFLFLCRIGGNLSINVVIQFLFTRAATTVAAIILETIGLYCHNSMSPSFGHLYTTLINGVSMGIAMFSIGTLYITTRNVRFC
jgi:hypothetical protein